MLSCITLTYKVSGEIIRNHLESHKVWLKENIDLGHFILAGPIENENADFILSTIVNEDHLQDVLKRDPFVEFDLVGIEVKKLPSIIKNKNFLF
ncbi:hypothetical protein RGH81_003721 [Acinetobacter nosocomialis]|nr:hypothetical protein [Acinetobacter nosocomialis]